MNEQQTLEKYDPFFQTLFRIYTHLIEQSLAQNERVEVADIKEEYADNKEAYLEVLMEIENGVNEFQDELEDESAD